MPDLPLEWKDLLFIFLILIFIGLSLALILLIWILKRVRRIQLPPNANWIIAMRMTPLVVVILLDLLDLCLDFFSAPFSWILLSYLGLSTLRGVTVIESLIPGTQFIPTMTIGWILARLSPDNRLATGKPDAIA